MKRIVIVHESMGIFVGGAMGVAFFSMLDTGGQCRVVLWDTEEEAREYISEWKPKQNPDFYSYVEVEALEEWATVAELVAAGLERYTLLLLAAARPLGSA
jgi:hypothetical protein